MADNHGHRRRERWARESECSPSADDTPEVKQAKVLLSKSTHTIAQAETAKRLCDSCPVKRECFDWAIVHDEWGFYGGFSRKERKEFYGLTEDLAVQAMKEGWLEYDYNRLSEDMMRVVKARVAQEKEEASIKKKQPKRVEVTLDFDWSLPDIPVLA